MGGVRLPEGWRKMRPGVYESPLGTVRIVNTRSPAFPAHRFSPQKWWDVRDTKQDTKVDEHWSLRDALQAWGDVDTAPPETEGAQP